MKREENAPQLLDLNKTKHTNKDLMQNLKDHLQFLEDKHDLKAKSATLTSLLSAVGSTAMIGGAGLGYFANNAGIDTPSTIGMATIGGIAVGASIVSGIVAHHQNKKAKKYRYFRQLSEAGLADSEKLQKTKDILKKDGSIEDVKQLVSPELARYIEMENLSFFTDERHTTNEDQLSIEGF